ncbi:hypothetical protein Ae201684P_000140 [Aphanomyces euteiches]|uniref:Anoctamin transmembrane domain-containing protein n=1 Tax=Aphanomyces euteiches TaxID=100861 RepID=A0A6G0XAC0_9STRA|nr:hypothetical protein Ae201684_006848 [Aphanomyces euteiches]KAH9086718.1 hypothetical protein Ae201684P_000140 [Aphanomyces euteiches]KAH9141054.1 hypothetical protein AeRB84_014737 [Aphanomyces euteiches]
MTSMKKHNAHLRQKLANQHHDYGSMHLDINDPTVHWDYAIAFQNPETRKPGTPEPPTSMEEILRRLFSQGLQFRLYYSSTRDIILCEIRCHYQRLKIEADRIDMPVLLDADELRKTAERGFPKLGIKPFPINDVKKIYDFPPYEYIHAAFEDDDDKQNLFAKKNIDGTVFAPVKRMKLIESIIISKECCDLDLDKLILNGSILACYPLHNEDEIAILAKDWIPACKAPWDQPLDNIRDYFGERIAFYFAYLGHYSTYLLYAAVFGLLIFIAQSFLKETRTTLDSGEILVISSNLYLIPAFGLFMCIWSTIFLETWKREQNVLAMKWGMSGLSEEEIPRPQYTGEPIHSPINGTISIYFPKTQKYQRVAMSWGVLLLLISIVFLLVAGIFRLRYLWTKANPIVLPGIFSHIPFGSLLASLANVVQITIMGRIYYKTFYSFNEYENHETDSEYEASLILKTFVFNFVNNFAALFYAAFLKEGIEGCKDQDCLGELAYCLAIVFGVQLVIGNVREILLPRFYAWLSNRSVVKGVSVSDKVSEAEKQFFLSTYEFSGTFDDYTEMIVQFGYCSLFVVSFPLTPLLALINNYMEIRVDGFRLLYENRRSRPRSAGSIGLWLEIVEWCTTIAIFTNAYVVVYTSNTFDYLKTGTQFTNDAAIDEYAQATKLLYFIIFVFVMMLFRFFLAQVIPDVPVSVTAQLKRQQFFNNKAIFRMPDDTVSKYVGNNDEDFDMTIHEH